MALCVLLVSWLLGSCLFPQDKPADPAEQYRKVITNFIVPGEEELLVLAQAGNDPGSEEVEAVYRRHYQTRIESALNIWGNRQLQKLRNFYAENFRLESSLNWGNARGLRGAIEAVVPLYAKEDKAWFLQPGAVAWDGSREQRRRDFNIGIAHRRLLRDRRMAAGMGAFFDYSAVFGLSRFGLGFDVQDAFNYTSAHFYTPLQKNWKDTNDGYQERAFSGMELYMRRQLLRQLDLTMAFTAWRRYEEGTGRDLGFGPGLRAGLDWEIARGLSLETSYEQGRIDDNRRWQVNLRFQLPAHSRLRGEPRLDLWRPFEREQRVLYAERNVRVKIEAADAQAGEGDGAAQLQLQLPRSLDDAVAGRVIPRSGTGFFGALAEKDFNAAERRFTITAGETGATVDIPIIDDKFIERNETFHAEIKLLMAPRHVVAGAPARITIMDNDSDDTGGISTVDAALSAQPQSVSENAGETPVIVTAKLTEPAPRDASIELTFAMPRGRATVETPDAIEIARDAETGATTFILSVTDNRDEDGNAEVGISAAALRALDEVRATRVMIEDDDPLQGAIAAAGGFRESAANDGSVVGSLTLTLSGAARFAGTLTPSFENTPQGLTPQLTRDSDTRATLSLRGSASAHARADSVGDFTIEFDDDDFGNTHIGHITGARAANLRIDFADTSVLRASGDTLSVGEGSSAAITLTLDRAGTDNAAVEGAYVLIDGSAAAGVDYIAPAESARAFRIPAGATSTSIRIDTINNGISDGGRTFTLRLVRANDSIAMLGAPSEVTVTIADDEGVPQLGVFSRTISAREDAGTVGVRLRIHPASSSPVSGSYTITGSADSAADYTAPALSEFTIDARQTITTINITLHDDLIDELDETATLRVIRADDETAMLGRAVTVLTIRDNDDPPALSAGDAGVTEAAGASAEVMLTLAGRSDRRITGNYRTTDGSATAGADYESVAGVFAFSPGGASSTVLRIPVVNDEISEPTENFTLTIAVDDAGLARLADKVAQVTIADDEGQPVMQVDRSSFSVDEGEPAPVTVNLNRASSRNIRGVYTLTAGSATANIDYDSAGGAFTIPAGARSASFRVATREDPDYEQDETFTLAIALAPGESGAALGTPASTLVTIENDDKARLAITPMPAGKTYGANDPAIAYSATFVDDDTKESVFSALPVERLTGEPAGVYAYRLKQPLPYNTGFAEKYEASLAGGNAFTIGRKTLGYVSTAASKEYDGKRNAPAGLAGGFTGIVSATVNGVDIDDTAAGRLVISGGEFADKSAGTGKAITGVTLAGAAAANYALPVIRGDITRREITYTSTNADKVYDDTTGPPADFGGAFAANGIIGGDIVHVQGGNYSSENVDTDIDITGVTLGGADAGNYALASASSISGTISKRPLRVTANGSGNTAPADLGALLDITDGDLVGGHTAAQILSGTIDIGARNGAVSPITIGTLKIATGLPAKNYTLDFTNGEFTYTALRQLAITPAAARKVYGGADPAIQYSANFDSNDDAGGVFGALPVERIAGENAGVYAYQLKNPVPFNPGFAAKYAPMLAGANMFAIDPKALRYASTEADKTYDGDDTRPADLGGSFTAGDVVDDTINGVRIDDTTAGRLELTGGAYAGKNAGDDKAITGIILAGTAAANYSLTAAVSGDITPKPATYTSSTADKVYDRSISAPADLRGAFAPAIIAGDSVRAQGGEFADKDAGDGKAITGIIFAGADAANYALTANVTGDITRKPVTYTSTAANKVYDGANTAPAELGGGFDADDIIAGDSVLVQGGSYAGANAGAGIAISGFALGGADAGNYALAGASSVSGGISKRPLRVTARGSGDTAPNASALADRALLVIGAAANEGLAGGDTAEQVFTGALAIGSRAGGAAPLIQGSLALNASPPGGNYTLHFTIGEFTFTALQQLAITPAAARKVYGGADPAIQYSANFDSNDDAGGVFGALPVERIAGENVGVYAYQLKNPVPFNPGFDEKYEFVLAGANMFAIDPKALRYASTEADKTYDGDDTRPADLGGSFTAGDVVDDTINGVRIDDTAAGRLELTGGIYAGKNAGDDKAINGITLAGTAAANYSLTAAVSGDITPKPATYTSSTADKVYDRSISAPADLRGAFAPAIIAGDSVRAQGGEFADKDAGDGKTITGIILAGADAANYALTANVTGDITRKPVTYTSTAANKVYDGANTAPAELGGGFDADDIIAGDSVLVQGGAYAGANAGAGIAISGFALGGADAGNYALAGASSVSGGISKRPLRVTARGSGDTAPSASALADRALLVIGATANEGLAGGDTAEQVFTGALAIGSRAGGAAPLIQGSLALNASPPGGNYTLHFTIGEFTFTALQQLAITPAAARKAYGENDPLIQYSANFDSNDDAGGVFGALPVERIAGENAGVYAYQLKNPVPFNPGFDEKYEFVLAGANMFAIDRRQLHYTSTEADKTYDGDDTRPADLGGSFTAGDVVDDTINGVRIDDTAAGHLELTGGIYAGKNAGDNKVISGITLAGDAAANYTLHADIRGEIEPRLVVVAAITLTKQYDANDAIAGAAIEGGEITGEVSGESLSLQIASGSDGAYAAIDAGGGIGINRLSGEDFETAGGNVASIPANYALPATISATGVITPKPLGVSAVTLVKVYDTTDAITGATLSGGEVAGEAGGERFTLQVARDSDGAYASVDVGDSISMKNMTSADFALNGAGPASKPENYELPASIAVTGGISKRPLRVSASGAAFAANLAAVMLRAEQGTPNEGLVAPHQLSEVLTGAAAIDTAARSGNTAPIVISTLAAAAGPPGGNYDFDFRGGDFMFYMMRMVTIPAAVISENASGAAREVTLQIAAGDAAVTPHFAFGAAASAGSRHAAPADLGQSAFAAAAPLAPVAKDATEFTLTLPVADDRLVEGDETLMLTISGEGIPAVSMDITIRDDENATIAFGNNAAARTTHALAAAETQATLMLPVAVSHPPDAPVTFRAVAAGSAAEPADYAIVNKDITFTPGGAQMQNLEIRFTDDAVFEPDEHILLSFADSSDNLGPLYTRANTADVTLTSEDAAPVLSLAPASLEATEGESAAFTLQLSHTSSRPVNATYTLTAGTAAGADYADGGGMVAIPAGETRAVINITTLADDINEISETFTLTLALADGETGAVLGAPASATITIIDNNPPVVGFETLSQRIAEGDDGTRELQLRIAVDPAPAVAHELIIGVNPGNADTATAGATASAAGADYVMPATRLQLPAGSTSAAVVLQIIGDTEPELDEVLRVALSPTSADVVYQIDPARDAAEITIGANDFLLNFARAQQTVAESAGVLNLAVALNHALAADFTGRLAFTAAAQHGAARPADYLANDTFTIAAGATTAVIAVEVVDDNAYEFGETAGITLLPDDARGVEAGATGTTMLTLQDNDEPTIALVAGDGASAARVKEGAAAGLRVIALPAGTDLSQRMPDYASIRFVAAADADTATRDALMPADFAAPALTLDAAAPAGEQARVTVQTVDDNRHEGDEVFVVSLDTDSLASGGDKLSAEAGKESVVVTIDDGDAPPVVSLSLLPDAIENDEPAVVVVTAASAQPADYSELQVRIPVGAIFTPNNVAAAIDDFVIEIPPGAQSASKALMVTPADPEVIGGIDFAIGDAIENAAKGAGATLLIRKILAVVQVGAVTATDGNALTESNRIARVPVSFSHDLDANANVRVMAREKGTQDSLVSGGAMPRVRFDAAEDAGVAKHAEVDLSLADDIYVNENRVIEFVAVAEPHPDLHGIAATGVEVTRDAIMADDDTGMASFRFEQPGTSGLLAGNTIREGESAEVLLDFAPATAPPGGGADTFFDIIADASSAARTDDWSFAPSGQPHTNTAVIRATEPLTTRTAVHADFYAIDDERVEAAQKVALGVRGDRALFVEADDDPSAVTFGGRYTLTAPGPLTITDNDTAILSFNGAEVKGSGKETHAGQSDATFEARLDKEIVLPEGPGGKLVFTAGPGASPKSGESPLPLYSKITLEFIDADMDGILSKDELAATTQPWQMGVIHGHHIFTDISDRQFQIGGDEIDGVPPLDDDGFVLPAGHALRGKITVKNPWVLLAGAPTGTVAFGGSEAPEKPYAHVHEHVPGHAEVVGGLMPGQVPEGAVFEVRGNPQQDLTVMIPVTVSIPSDPDVKLMVTVRTDPGVARAASETPQDFSFFMDPVTNDPLPNTPDFRFTEKTLEFGLGDLKRGDKNITKFLPLVIVPDIVYEHDENIKLVIDMLAVNSGTAEKHYAIAPHGGTTTVQIKENDAGFSVSVFTNDFFCNRYRTAREGAVSTHSLTASEQRALLPDGQRVNLGDNRNCGAHIGSPQNRAGTIQLIASAPVLADTQFNFAVRNITGAVNSGIADINDWVAYALPSADRAEMFYDPTTEPLVFHLRARSNISTLYIIAVDDNIREGDEVLIFGESANVLRHGLELISQSSASPTYPVRPIQNFALTLEDND